MLYIDSTKYSYVGTDSNNLHVFKRKSGTVEYLHVEQAKFKMENRVLTYASLLSTKKVQ